MPAHFLLLQIRNPGDPMLRQEVEAFARVLQCETSQITAYDILVEIPPESVVARHDVVFVGGSGHYSATTTEPWIEPVLDLFRRLRDNRRPTFGSCWGFQAMARACGGQVVNDLERAELGTNKLRLTEAGQRDPIFGELPETFFAQMGHEDRVVELPENATLLASSDMVENQAYKLNDAPIYCTQFHPELNRAALLGRVKAYPEYIEKVAGMTMQAFCDQIHDTPEVEELLRRFVRAVLA